MTVAGNFIGTDATGQAAATNTIGVFAGLGGSGTIGGTAPADRNVISGNTAGVRIESDNNLVQGNLIGPTADGAAGVTPAPAVAARPIGVQIVAGNNNTVGGSAAGAGNVICAVK